MFFPPPSPLFAEVWATAFLGSTVGRISLRSLHHAPSPEPSDVKQDRWTNSFFWKLVTEGTCQDKYRQEYTDYEAPSVSQVITVPESRLRLSSPPVHKIQWERAQKQIYLTFPLATEVLPPLLSLRSSCEIRGLFICSNIYRLRIEQRPGKQNELKPVVGKKKVNHQSSSAHYL